MEVIIAAAGGAAHLAGVVAAHTVLPVLGVPMKAWSLDGLDSLLSTVQMPRGVPVGTLAIGKAGAVNAALLAAQILGNKHPEIREAFRKDRQERKQSCSRWDGPSGLDPAILPGRTTGAPEETHRGRSFSLFCSIAIGWNRTILREVRKKTSHVHVG